MPLLRQATLPRLGDGTFSTFWVVFTGLEAQNFTQNIKVAVPVATVRQEQLLTKRRGALCRETKVALIQCACVIRSSWLDGGGRIVVQAINFLAVEEWVVVWILQFNLV